MVYWIKTIIWYNKQYTYKQICLDWVDNKNTNFFLNFGFENRFWTFINVQK